jgi:hypothetical protein
MPNDEHHETRAFRVTTRPSIGPVRRSLREMRDEPGPVTESPADAYRYTPVDSIIDSLLDLADRMTTTATELRGLASELRRLRR